MKFLIQTINGRVKHDFTFTLLESIEYHNWKNINSMSYSLFEFINGRTDFPYNSKITPVGRIDFILPYLKHCYGIIPVPQNIPIELMKEEWTGRHVFYGTEKDIIGTKFVKSRDEFKGYTEICDIAPEGRYQISDVIDIQSEWRTFVFEGKMVGLQNYGGKFDLFPDISRIKGMIGAYKNAPVAYTLDIGIINPTKYSPFTLQSVNETVIIEIHPMISVGLYGFADHRLLPFMFHRSFHELTQK